jgi:ApaG protein
LADSCTEMRGARALRHVHGRGVVGIQPEIMPGQLFKYDSACDLNRTFGSMHGHCLIKGGTARPFKVTIPQFRLEVPWALS